MDDIPEVTKNGSVEKITEFLNSVHAIGSIKFTYEVQQDDKLPFLDINITICFYCSFRLSLYGLYGQT